MKVLNLNNTTKRITDTAVIIGIMVIFAFIGFYMFPILSIFYPVPAIILAHRHSIKYSILATVASSIIAGILTNILVGVSILLFYGLPGIALAYMIKKRYKSFEILVGGTAVFLVFTIISIEMFQVITGVGFVDELRGIFNESLKIQLNIIKGLNPSDYEVNTLEKMFQSTIDFVLSIIPAILIISSMFISYINYWTASTVLRRMGNKVVQVPRFKNFRLPNNVIIGTAVILLATFILKYINVFYYETILINVTVLVFTIFFIQGIAVILFFIDKIKVPKALKIILIILVIFSFPLMMLISILGLLDSLLNLRKIGYH